MKNIFYTILMISLFISCSDNEFAEYDGATADFGVIGFEASLIEFPVVIDTDTSLTVFVNVSKLSDEDRTFQIELDEEDTTQNLNNVSFPDNVTIPAGSYQGTFEITADDTDPANDITTVSNNLVFNLIQDSDDLNTSVERVVVSIFQVCPVPDDYFTGAYEVQDVVAVLGGGFGDSNIETAVYEVTSPSPGSTVRNLTVNYLPGNGGFAVDVRINLVCNEIRLTTDTGVFCTQGNTIQWTVPDNPSSYDTSDDSQFFIDYVDDPTGSCLAAPGISTALFIKQ